MNSEFHTIIELLKHRASESGQQKIYSFLNRQGDCHDSLTFAQLDEKATTVAIRLQSQGIVDCPVLLYYPHGPDFIVAFFGTILAGAWPVPVSKGRGQQWNMFLAVLESSSARTVLTTESRRRSVLEHLPVDAGVQVLGVDKTTMDSGCCEVERWQVPDVNEDDIAFIQYTSGSTAQPKGVVITHKNVMHNSHSIQHAFNISRNDVGLCWLPFHHDMGLIGHIVQPLFSGIHNYFMNPVDFVAEPMRWLRAISRYGATVSGGPDFAYAHCCTAKSLALSSLDLSCWRVAYSGSERVLPETLQRFSSLFDQIGFDKDAFYPCYGMAEATLFVSGQRGVQIADFVSSETTKSGCYQSVSLGRIGTTWSQTDIRVVNPDTGQMLPEGDVGEIHIRSPSLSPGYYRNESVSRLSFNRQIGVESGYFRTGDAGRIQGGLLYFEGRLKNLIKRRGRSVFSEDIEAQVELKMMDMGVRRCAAISVLHEAVEKLVLMLEVDGESEIDVSHKLTHEACAIALDGSGVTADVVRILPRNSLPLTSSGKLRRTACRDLYLTTEIFMHASE